MLRSEMAVQARRQIECYDPFLDFSCANGGSDMAKATLIVLELPNQPGAAAAVARVLAKAGVNILSIFGWGPQGVVQILVDSPRKATKALAAAGTSYSEARAEVVELANKPGTLLAYLEKLAKKGANLRSLCATSNKSSRKAVVVSTMDA
jgi:hypothetical protein